MYRLAQDADVSFMIGAELVQVCIGRNEIILNFEPDVRVTLLSEFSISQGTRTVAYAEGSAGGSALLPLLHDVISAAASTPRGGLVLTFQSGRSLEIPDTSDQYESFLIAGKGREIIV